MRTAGRYLRITERSSPLVKVSGTTDFIELRRCVRFYGRALMVLQPESGLLEQLRYGPADSAICVMNGSRTTAVGPPSLLGLACLSQWTFANSVLPFAFNFRNDKKHGVRFTINTDGPEMYGTNVHKEQELLRKAGILTPQGIASCNRWAFEASFLSSHTNADPAGPGGSRKADKA